MSQYDFGSDRRPRLGLIWAQAEGGVIGAGGTMPWHLPEDLAHFKEVTLGAPVVMGRKTWDSLPERFRPLPGRRNIVITRDEEWSSDGAEVVLTVEEALTRAAEGLGREDWVWVIGGSQIFAEVLAVADRIELTEINTQVAGDTFAPALGNRWMRDHSDPATGWHHSATGLEYRFVQFNQAK